MHLRVFVACRFTTDPSINVFSLTSPLKALNALLAWKVQNTTHEMSKKFPASCILANQDKLINIGPKDVKDQNIYFHIVNTRYPRNAVWIVIAAASSLDFPAYRVTVGNLTTSGAAWAGGGAGTSGSVVAVVVTATGEAWFCCSFTTLVNFTSSCGDRGGNVGGAKEVDSYCGCFCFPNHFFFDLSDLWKNSY